MKATGESYLVNRESHSSFHHSASLIRFLEFLAYSAVKDDKAKRPKNEKDNKGEKSRIYLSR